MRRELTGVNDRIQRKEEKVNGSVTKGKKIKKDTLQVETLNGVGHGMSEGVEKKKRRVGRPGKVIPVEQLKKALQAAEIGIPLERVAIICGFPSGNAGGWADYLRRNPSFAADLEKARLEGELQMSLTVRQCGNGWQGSAWLLERTRGYVARASLEHTGKGGKELSVSGNLLGAFGGQSK
jgi:hypothetical protein